MNTYSHSQVVSCEVTQAFVALTGFDRVARKAAYVKAARVVSGLLKAAAKNGSIERVEFPGGRVTSGCIDYRMTEEQLVSIREQAIKRAYK